AVTGAATRWTALAVLVQTTSLATAAPAWPAAPPPSARAPAAPSPAATPEPRAAPAPAPAAAQESAPDGERCRRAALPRAPGPASAREAASALADCLTGGRRPDLPAHGGPGVSLTARTMTVTGLLCPLLPLAHGVCRAESVVLDDPVVSYGGDHELCTSARRLTVRGTVRLRAEWLTGRVFGLLPVGFSTRVLPPVPVPYVRLTGVRALGIALSADGIRGDRVTMGTGGECG
ncbi:hypothetical protein ACFU99_37805, partial [Streptomyces sp. NPDC057654]|uniref:hypothetical protein n=1 Tax=Streptomyces sp. NPDC057654 TaxID=3346196 RepID=UPI0036A80B83